MFCRLRTSAIPSRAVSLRYRSLPQTSTALQSRRRFSDEASSAEEWIKKYMNELRLDYNDRYCKHKTFLPFSDQHKPKVQPTAFVSPSATLAGNVEVWRNASIWNNVVLRGDVNLVRIGAYTAVLENTVIHESIEPLSLEHDGSSIIGHYCWIGSGVRMRAVTIEDEVMIGAGCVLETGAYVEEGAWLARGSFVGRGVRIPGGQLWAGRPAQYVRHLTDRERNLHIHSALDHSTKIAAAVAEGYQLPPHAYIELVKLGLDQPVPKSPDHGKVLHQP